VSSRLAAAAIYLGLMSLWIYGVANRWDPDSGEWLLPVLVLLQLALGWTVARWWAVLFPVLLPFIALPAGTPPITPDNAEPFPLWFGMAYAALFAIPLVAAGVLARRIHERGKSSRFAR
jgi:cytochrome c biogenesis protein CcdA